MITLKQREHYLLGSEKDIADLVVKKSAKILVISDSHGQRDLFRCIVGRIGPSCDALVFCGDGAGDFASCMDDAASDKVYAACVPPVVAFVKGNGDSNRFPVCFNPVGKEDDSVYRELAIPRRQIFSAVEHTIYVVHGHEQRTYYGIQLLKKEAERAGADIALYGHTHIADETRDTVYMVNPGSPCLPRGGVPSSFAVLELDGLNVNTVFYRIEATLQGLQFIPFLPGKTYLWN
ncbi:MAG: YfcE family phosphodiesterase [Treponema sp.]|nr:YfcE family phosphodiesterase [Treponema sp.]